MHLVDYFVAQNEMRRNTFRNHPTDVNSIT